LHYIFFITVFHKLSNFTGVKCNNFLMGIFTHIILTAFFRNIKFKNTGHFRGNTAVNPFTGKDSGLEHLKT